MFAFLVWPGYVENASTFIVGRVLNESHVASLQGLYQPMFWRDFSFRAWFKPIFALGRQVLAGKKFQLA
jgi:hypothetical protein